jgi:hypothetical protein
LHAGFSSRFSPSYVQGNDNTVLQGGSMRRSLLGSLLGLAVLWTVPAAAQGTNAGLTGSIIDATGAVLPGVTLTLENSQTGVRLSTATNDAGVYLFPSVQPGLYLLAAEWPGFRTIRYNGLVLEVSAQVTHNFTMEVAGAPENVAVTADLNSPLAATTASVGGVINGVRVSDLPLPDRNTLGLVDTQAGIVRSPSNNGTTEHLAGARRLAVNVTRDGINVMQQLNNLGVNSVVYLSADLVDEVRVVTSPSDAELGRGSGQVQISTRAGTNEFHGSVFESHRNTALNANTFFNNQNGDPREFLIRNQFGGRLGGPIVRNKTFFHFLYDAQREVSKEAATSIAYTATARQGIFRFFPNVQNANFNATVPTVDIHGNPVRPASATGDLQSLNVFGRDPLRPAMDPTGTVQRLMALIPLPNNFRFGEGLNTAGYTWNRRETSDRDQYNVRIDHHFDDSHRLNFSWTRQTTSSLNGYAPQTFPQTPGGFFETHVNFFSGRATSVLTSRIVNEFYAGTQPARERYYASWEREGKAVMPVAGGIGYRPNFTAASGVANVFPVGPPFGGVPAGSISRLSVFGDNVSWVSGRHTFKFGGETRFGVGDDAFVDVGVTPTAVFGADPRVAVTGFAPANVPGIGSNQAGAQNLLINLSGSLASYMHRFYTTGGANPVYEAIPEGRHADGDIYQKEFGAFVKDDWKVRPELTLNLGVRYEYYAVPWLSANNQGGGTPHVVGGSNGLFGWSGSSFADLYRPGPQKGPLTTIEFVGPRSPNPGKQLHQDDWNNFAPSAGLSWRIPYLGRDKTVLRMGYGLGYEKIPLFVFGNTVGLTPGTFAAAQFTSGQYLDLARIRLPLSPVGTPLDPIALTDRNQPIGVYDSELATGYVQNWNLSIQRELPGRMSLDIRYLGSKGTKLVRQMDINEVNIFESGILEAFLAVQSGGNSPLLDRMFNGLTSAGAVIGTTVAAAQFLRSSSATRDFFANNHAGGFAEYLNNTNFANNTRGNLLRRANLPENLIVGNPQFSQARIAANLANSTYHAMQIELNKRFSSGWTLQSNYTWSRTLGETAGNSNPLIDVFYRNGRNRHLDKRLLPFHRTHAFKSNGTLELPIGPGKRFLNNGPGLLSRIVERWQIGGILNLVSGQPITLTTLTRSFNQYSNNASASLVGPLPKSYGRVDYDAVGVVYFKGLGIVRDPASAALTAQQGLNQASTMQAITDSSGQIIAVNAAPGKLGSIGPNYLEGPGQVRFDANLVKRVRIGEGKEFEFRVDAINVLNRANFDNPETNINSTNFGRITATLGGSRIIVLNARIHF